MLISFDDKEYLDSFKIRKVIPITTTAPEKVVVFWQNGETLHQDSYGLAKGESSLAATELFIQKLNTVNGDIK